METRRRQYLTNPGESLVLPLVAHDVIDRRIEWAATVGTPGIDIVTSALVSIPIPLRAPGAKHHPDTNAAAFWHPILWLGDHLAHPIPGEPLDVWAVRVALELTYTGAYDAETGTFVDILSIFELDSDDPVVQARITEWLAGAPDKELDSVTFAAAFGAPEDLGQQLLHATEYTDYLRPASWAVMTNSLLEISYAAAADPEINAEILAAVATRIIHLAQATLGESIPSVEGEVPAHSLWQQVLDDTVHWEARPMQANIDGPWNALIESLSSIRSDYWVFVDALREVENDAPARTAETV
ncbi:hypothetical protein [Leifsonia sp. Leaf264]|uniref:hypothetical protein n=1 Tax=Leifsonia sp. Leaf264 TaxID=1736314 RepID=UPI0007011754|nr:hypothetical protein [Leifsonia sp. Leaf264]KQO98660.1 hypothetical protein ASF30_11400 [Leifsonia sp. Leaf264]